MAGLRVGWRANQQWQPNCTMNSKTCQKAPLTMRWLNPAIWRRSLPRHATQQQNRKGRADSPAKPQDHDTQYKEGGVVSSKVICLQAYSDCQVKHAGTADMPYRNTPAGLWLIHVMHWHGPCPSFLHVERISSSCSTQVRPLGCMHNSTPATATLGCHTVPSALKRPMRGPMMAQPAAAA